MERPLLRVGGLTRRFGEAVAVSAVSFEVAPGGAVGMIGPNGAGKSTLLALLGGQVRPDAGTIELDGARIDHLPAHRRVARGLVRTFQIPRPFRRLTVRENLLVASPARPAGWLGGALSVRPRATADTAEAAARAEGLLRDIGLAGHADRPAGELSGGQHKLLDIARALMAAPRVLLLDEPCAGVAPALLEVLSAMLGRLRTQGVGVVIVEHDITFVARHCDGIVALAQGGVLSRGTPEAVCGDPLVQDAFLGTAYA
ncbi:MAG: ABC transporter ATP-binding protein [Rhodospirillales bacterium]|nr:ABC transporter ATP-binding protein [Rhodospirillales bacterium]MDE2199639.1 ABC transporter ATP-binding protein [Rhodospirillales bacterium]MDE2574488.1 ABC transporter ATP-binding protein [Rhodospirillales bacterium]